MSPVGEVHSGRQFSMRSMFLAVAFLCLLLGLVTPLCRFVARQQEYNALRWETRAKIEALGSRCPPDVPAEQWQRAVDWTSNVIGQIYFSPNHGDIDSLRELCSGLEDTTGGPVDLGTLRWVWDECEKAKGHGQVYAIRFRDVRLLTKGPITDDRLPELWSLDKVDSLDLSNTQVTDAGLVHIEQFSNLKSVVLYNTQTTDEGVRRLQQALPDCKIIR